MKRLIKSKTEKGRWIVRPAEWEKIFGSSDESKHPVSHLFESNNEEDCDNFIMNYRLLELVKENPSLPIVPITHYEICAGDCKYRLGKVKSVDVNEYALNEWNSDNAVVFKDKKEDVSALIEDENKYDGSKEAYKKAEADVNNMWIKAIIIRINL